jgi:hypothetical protein
MRIGSEFCQTVLAAFLVRDLRALMDGYMTKSLDLLVPGS